MIAGRQDVIRERNSEKPSGSDIPAEGWYLDPNGLPCDRYWDGNEWSERTRPQTYHQPPVARNLPVNQAVNPNPTFRYTTRTVQRNPHAQPSNGFGIASLVLGIIGLFTPFFAPGFAVLFGWLSLRKCDRGEATNRTMSLWGIWLGVLGFIGWVLIFFFWQNVSTQSVSLYDPIPGNAPMSEFEEMAEFFGNKTPSDRWADTLSGN